MSRDGYLPPGCTERDVDMAAPGYYDEPEIPDHEGDMGLDEQSIRTACERLLLKGGRAHLMCVLNDIIKEHRLDQFHGMIRAAE